MATLVGCDPELFLKDSSGNWKASCGLFGGTKKDPLPFGNQAGFALQEDNVALEFNIPPAWNADDFDSKLQFALDELRSRANALGLGLSISASAIFPESELVHPNAKEFGCDPDWNAWTGQENPRPKAENHLLRSCGGHVHCGVKKFDHFQRIEMIRMLDVLLGIPSIFLDKDNQRRKLYGGPGAYRDKPYGVEYRTLSNFWIEKAELRKWVFNQVQKATDKILKKEYVDPADGEYIQRAIMEGNEDLALLIQERYPDARI